MIWLALLWHKIRFHKVRFARLKVDGPVLGWCCYTCGIGRMIGEAPKRRGGIEGKKMADKKAVPIAKVNKGGQVECPTCGFIIPVPETHALTEGTGMCPEGHPFLIDEDCVHAYYHFTAKQGSGHSRELAKNRDDTPKVIKDMQDQISEGELKLPPPAPGKITPGGIHLP